MKKVLKRIGLILVVGIIVIQFIRPAKNSNPDITANDITRVYAVPDSVKTIFAKGCNDCHSNNTTYPWYSLIQPVDWWMTNHIKDGKRHLNFSEFGSYTLLKQSKKLKQVAKEIDEGGMPLDSYTWIHKNAIFSNDEKQAVITWANSLSADLLARVPPEEVEKDRKETEERRRLKEGKK